MSIPAPIINIKGRWHIAPGYPGATSSSNKVGFTQKKNAHELMRLYAIKQQQRREGKLKEW